MPSLPKALPNDGVTGWGADIRQALTSSYAQLGTYTKTVAGAGETQAVKDACDYVCDGVADEVQINAALEAVGSETISRGSNGGKVLLVGRSFSISSPIKMQTQTTLEGLYGQFGTQVIAAASASWTGAECGMIELATTNTQYVQVQGLWLNGNTRNTAGLYWAVATGQEYDSYLVAKDLYIWRPNQAGMRIRNLSGGRTRGNHFSGIRIIDAGTYGVWQESPDSFYERVDTGSAGSHGFYMAHSNNRVVNCKAWYSDGSGFYIAGGRDNQLTGCESQDNEQHGYYIASPRNTLSSCCADSNAYGGGSNNYDGFHILGHGTNVHGSASDKNEGSRGINQRYGVNLSGSPRGVIVDVTAWQNRLGAVNGSPGADSHVRVTNYT